MANRRNSKNEKTYEDKSKRRKPRPKNDKQEDRDTLELEKGSRNNDPNWYFTNKELAEQVTRLSMRNFAGKDIVNNIANIRVPNIMTVYYNPAPGVQASYTEGGQKSGINMAGFKLYTKLSAMSGRTANYAPQDVSTIILAFGELISMTEFIRRAFGVAYTYSQRNRSFPKQVLKAMGVNAADLFTNYSRYRNRFNQLITRMNQLPVPKDIMYFDKCASMYERIYTDADSPMANVIIPCPASTWMLDETSYEGGSILTTKAVCLGGDHTTPSYANLSVYFDILEQMVDKLLASSTLNIVYSDILNYVAKNNKEVWLFDYLQDGYAVVPVFDPNFLLQLHNTTFVGHPISTALLTPSPDQVITPSNDVYPNVDNNSLYYNPGFPPFYKSGMGDNYIIDFPMGDPAVEDRVEVTRYMSMIFGIDITVEGTQYVINAVIPDHYGVYMAIWSNDTTADSAALTLLTETHSCPNEANAIDVAAYTSKFDWAPFFYVRTAAGTFTGKVIGDVNYYTSVDQYYLRPIHDFVGLDLYDLR